MFAKEVYTKRRSELKALIKSGIILFPADHEIPMYEKNCCLPFRQDDNFLYYAGISAPNLILLMDLDEGTETLYGNDISIDDQVWTGSAPKIADMAAQCGITNTNDLSSLKHKMAKAQTEGRKVHFLPQHRDHNVLKIESLTGISHHHVSDSASVELIKAVIKQRSVKSDIEIMEIEQALDVSFEIYQWLQSEIRPGIYERELLGKIESLVTAHGSNMAFPPTLTVKGQYLHNPHYDNILKDGDLLLADTGVLSKASYCSDITRTYPVSGKFSPAQKEIYEIVLNAQLKAIEAIKPGIQYKEVHLKAAYLIAEGLKNIGLMRGNVDDAVKEGAHALFFPHGIGHMLGLAPHDMEGWGRDFAGYDENVKRSTQFGTAYLRMARELHPNFVVTVEPGIYFIPELIALWASQQKLKEFINYDKLENYKGIGIRIEDDIVVTQTGCRVLGKPIPKTVSAIEKG